MYKPEGIISSMVTPFDDEENIIEESFRELISRQIDAGVHGIGVAPNTGEFINLTFNDLKKIIDISVDEVKGRVGVIVGALSPSMRFNIEIAKYAKAAKADAILLTPPYYIHPSDEGLFEYFRRIGKIGIPMVIFNHPGRTPYNLMPDIIERLLTIDTFVGIKDVDPSMANIVKKLTSIDNRISYLVGKDDIAFYHFLMGGHGGFLALANLMPKMLVQLYDCTKAGNIEMAKDIHLKVLDLCEAVYVEDYPSSLKEGLKMLGYNGGRTRTPLHVLKESSRERLRQSMKNAGLL